MESPHSQGNAILNEKICSVMGFDGFNGSHCYDNPTSEWTDGPHNHVFESFEEMYNYLDEDKKTRLLEILDYYQKQQQYYTSSSVMWSVYISVMIIFMVIQIIFILWYLARRYGIYNNIETETSGGITTVHNVVVSRPWPWSISDSIVSHINEWTFQVFFLLMLAAVNSIIWPVTLLIFGYVFLFQVVTLLSGIRKPIYYTDGDHYREENIYAEDDIRDVDVDYAEYDEDDNDKEEIEMEDHDEIDINDDDTNKEDQEQKTEEEKKPNNTDI